MTTLDVELTKVRCPRASEHKNPTDDEFSTTCLRQRSDGTVFCAVHGDNLWNTQHSLECEVTKQRANLLAELAQDPDNVYLLGAVPEYDEGGDQEAELCDCGVIA